MVYLFSTLFLFLGIAVGRVWRDRLFHDMCDQGQLLFKADGKWVGEPEAFEDIRGMFVE
jgi:hypothetical protein